tara:strand:- start:515 stop:1660 length:1146 start_codon:yes stop_codon:yes gene_type:complete
MYINNKKNNNRNKKMKINLKLASTVLLSFLICFNTLEGASKKRRGTAGAQELLIPVGARNISMSCAFMAGITGVEAAAWNPAGVSGIEGSGQAMFSHTNWLAGIGVNYAAVASKFNGESYFGLTARTLDFGSIPITTTEDPDGTGATFTPSYVTLGFLFSKQMTNRIRFGADFKIIDEGIMRVNATGFVIDAGVQYASSAGDIKLGAALKNLGLNMNFGGPDLEEFHSPEGSEPGTPNEPRRVQLQDFEMPTTLELAVAYGAINVGPGEVSLGASFLNNNFSFDEYRFGGEMTLFDILALRTGLAISYDPEPFGADGIEGTADDDSDEQFEYESEEFLWGPTFGFGINTQSFTNLNITVDYAYRATAIFEDTQWLTVSFGF